VLSHNNLVAEFKRNYFVITGAPGVGKTALINRLREIGFDCIDEPARKILAEQRASNGTGIPEKNPKQFTDLLLTHSIASYEISFSKSTPVIFDRGVTDSVGYADHFGIDTAPFELAAQNYKYNEVVFVLSPWKEIYRTDDERKMTFEATLQFHEQILRVYRGLGYKFMLVPSESIIQRASFVGEAIDKLLGSRGR